MPKRSYSSTAGESEAVSTEGMTFELDGVEFTCHGEFDSNDMTDLASALMDADENWVDPQALGAVGQLFATILGADTNRAFRRHRRANRTHPEVVSQILLDLIEDITDRPTQKPSASPRGRQAPAGRSSPAGSRSKAPASRRAEVVAARSQTARTRTTAVDPGGIIPPDWAGSGDVVTAPGLAAAEEPDRPVRRVVNLGDATRTHVEPIAATG